MHDFAFVPVSHTAFLVLRDGVRFGEVELIATDWVFHRLGGLGGAAYAFGCTPADALQQWIAASGRGERRRGR